MTCCEPEAYRREHRYGIINATVHGPHCPYAPGHPYRGDLTPQDKPTLPESVKPSQAMAHWMKAPTGCECAMCQYVDAHLDDEDDYRESIVDTSDDPVVPT
jgi:hypothetical protein